MSLFDLNFPLFNNKIQITLHQFLQNPTGKKSSVFARREFIKHDLNRRYDSLINKYKDFYHKIYKDNESYYFHFKIPSETFEGLLYDVVLEFVPDDEKFIAFKSIQEYSMHFFSNSPHMTFTYTYVLKQGGVTIDALETAQKYSKIALTTPPKVTNPVEIFGFEKSCYYAAIYIDRHKIIDKDVIEKQLEDLTVGSVIKFYNSIKSQNQKILEYNKLKKEANKNKVKLRRRRISKQEKEHRSLVKNFNLRQLAKSTFKSVFDKKK